jgi:hypothetical protein
MKYPNIEKIDKLILSNSKLLKIKLIKPKIYEKKNYIKNITLEEIKLRLKKALYIIYLYCIHDKRILFVGGNSLKMYLKLKKLLKNTKHFIIPEKKWIPGILTNKILFKPLLYKQRTNIVTFSKNLMNIKKKPDLIVIFDEIQNKIALSEGYLSNIPIISLNSLLTIFNNYSDYKVPGNFSFNKKTPQNNFFSVLLVSILKKSKITKIKNFSIIKYKLNTIARLKRPIYRYNYNRNFKRGKHYKKKFYN